MGISPSRKLAAIAILTSLSLTAAAQGPPPQKDRISAAAIVSRYISAIGGADALREMETLEVRGDVKFFPSTRRYDEFQFYFKAPSSDLFRFDSVGHGSVLLGHEHGKLWVRNIGIPVGILNGIPANVMAQDWMALAQPYNEQLYKGVEVVGRSKVQGKPAFAVRFQFKSGDVQVRYYDCDSFLLVGLDQVVLFRDQINGPDRAYRVETDFFKYKTFGRLNFPTLLEFQTSAQTLDVEVETIKTNATISDSEFEKR